MGSYFGKGKSSSTPSSPSHQTQQHVLRLPSIPLAGDKNYDQGEMNESKYLKESVDQFRTKVRNGQFDLNSQYTYIVDNDGYIRYYKFVPGVTLPGNGAGHTAMLKKSERIAKPVKYAGNFYTNGSGHIKLWMNNSGHFKPNGRLAEAIADYLGIDHSLFKDRKWNASARKQIVDMLNNNQYWDHDHDVIAWYDSNDFNRKEFNAVNRQLMAGGFFDSEFVAMMDSYNVDYVAHGYGGYNVHDQPIAIGYDGYNDYYVATGLSICLLVLICVCLCLAVGCVVGFIFSWILGIIK
eukprot:256007_1